MDRILRPYLSFKNNSSDGSKIVFCHTELQICSIIDNTFLAKHVTLFEDQYQEIIKINLSRNNKSWNEHDKKLANNLMKRYLSDILNDYWSGSGDSKLNEVIKNKDYYSGDLSKKSFLIHNMDGM